MMPCRSIPLALQSIMPVINVPHCANAPWEFIKKKRASGGRKFVSPPQISGYNLLIRSSSSSHAPHASYLAKPHTSEYKDWYTSKTVPPERRLWSHSWVRPFRLWYLHRRCKILMLRTWSQGRFRGNDRRCYGSSMPI